MILNISKHASLESVYIGTQLDNKLSVGNSSYEHMVVQFNLFQVEMLRP
jgi:hypothetical protein